MKIEKFVLGSIETNGYLAINEAANEAVLVDPATCPDYLVSHIKSKGLQLKAIFLTHGHFDHAMGVPEWVREFQVPVYAHEAERVILEDAKMNLSTMFGADFSYHDATYIKDGDKVEVSGYTFECIHTPGHTIGGCCYYVESEHVLFSGDTMFAGTVGRSDFYTGDESTLFASIREKLLDLPTETIVYPGHNAETTIAREHIVWGRNW